jgi:hypothetical protein
MFCLDAARRRGGRDLNPRIKKLIALAVLLPGLLVYIGGIVTLAEKVPDFWLAKLAYFTAAGLAWALPVIPLMKWTGKNTSRGAERQK